MVCISLSLVEKTVQFFLILRENCTPTLRQCSYPEIREFVKTFENVDWIKPKLTFRKVIEKYGYPFIGKEISNCIYGARKGSKTRLKRLQGAVTTGGQQEIKI
jgi:hypothetical protein